MPFSPLCKRWASPSARLVHSNLCPILCCFVSQAKAGNTMIYRIIQDKQVLSANKGYYILLGTPGGHVSENRILRPLQASLSLFS